MIRALDLMMKEFPNDTYKMAEIGVREGHTSEVLMRYIHRVPMIVDKSLYYYYGVDSLRDKVDPKVWEGNPLRQFIVGLSSDLEVLAQIPNDLHWCFIDANHSREYVFIDAINYSKKIRPRGFLAFHDTNPEVQGTCPQFLKSPDGDGRNPDDVTGPGIGVLEALAIWNPEANGFELVFTGVANPDPNDPRQVSDTVQDPKFGFRVYQKIK